MAFVLDASVVLTWLFEDELSAVADEAAERSYQEAVFVPHHWFLEVTSAILRGERRKRTSSANSANFLKRLQALAIEVDTIEPEEVLFTVLPLARAHRLSVYDAAYLELAERRGLPLATLDQSLADAARSVGIDVVGRAE